MGYIDEVCIGPYSPYEEIYIDVAKSREYRADTISSHDLVIAFFDSFQDEDPTPHSAHSRHSRTDSTPPLSPLHSIHSHPIQLLSFPLRPYLYIHLTAFRVAIHHWRSILVSR
jgi:hypothetical protein